MYNFFFCELYRLVIVAVEQMSDVDFGYDARPRGKISSIVYIPQVYSYAKNNSLEKMLSIISKKKSCMLLMYSEILSPMERVPNTSLYRISSAKQELL